MAKCNSLIGGLCLTFALAGCSEQNTPSSQNTAGDIKMIDPVDIGDQYKPFEFIIQHEDPQKPGTKILSPVWVDPDLTAMMENTRTGERFLLPTLALWHSINSQLPAVATEGMVNTIMKSTNTNKRVIDGVSLRGMFDHMTGKGHKIPTEGEHSIWRVVALCHEPRGLPAPDMSGQ